MPGISGVVALTGGSVHKTDMERMLQSMTKGYDPIFSILEANAHTCFIGLSSKETFTLQKSSSHINTEKVALIVDGEFYSYEDKTLDSAGQLEITKKISECSDIESISSILGKIDGVFSMAMYIKEKGMLIVAVDVFGLKPVYLTKNENKVIFSSEVKSISALMHKTPNIDLSCAAEIINFGHPLTPATLLEGVQRIPPATLMMIDSATGHVVENRYWKIESIFPKSTDVKKTVEFEDLLLTYENAVSRRSGEKDKLCLPISGGLDSRSIAAVMGENAKGLYSYSLGLTDSMELDSALAVGKIAKVKSNAVLIDQKTDASPKNMAEADILPSDGMKPPLGWYTYLYDEMNKTSNREILMVGLGAEVAKLAMVSPVKFDSQFNSLETKEEMLAYFSNGLKQENFRNGELSHIFTNDFWELLQKGQRQSLKDLFKYCDPSLKPIDVMHYWYVAGYLSYHAVINLMNRRPFNEIRFPFADKKLLTLLASAPPKLRTHAKIQLESIRKHSPKMLSVKNVNTGSPLDESSPKMFLRKVFGRLSLIAKRLFSSGTVINRRDELQRGVLKELIVETLSSKSFFSKGIVNQDVFLRELDDYMNGKDNGMSSLLTKLISIEIAYKKFEDLSIKEG